MSLRDRERIELNTLQEMVAPALERFEEEFDGALWVARLRALYDEVSGDQ